MPGRDVKHQGASEPSGFRQKFSRRSLGRCSAQRSWVPANLGLEPSLRPRPRPPPSPAPGSTATSLAWVLLRRKAMLMRILRVPTLAGHARGGGVGRAPVALTLPAEAIECRGFLARLCLGPLDGPRSVGAEPELKSGLGLRPNPTPKGLPPGVAPFSSSATPPHFSGPAHLPQLGRSQNSRST